MALYYERFGDDVADTHPRVEGAHRVLEDQLEVLAKELETALRESRDIGAFDNYLAGRGAVEGGDDTEESGFAAA
jgi:hypothetical protein